MPQLLTNATTQAAGAAYQWPGGNGQFEVSGTWNGATVTLQAALQDGTYTDVTGTALTADGRAYFALAPGSIRANVTGAAPTSVSAVAWTGPGVATGTSSTSGGTSDATAANQTTQITAANLTNTNLGGVTETAPATDTASSGLNGRLQRVAQRLSTLIASMFSATAASDASRVPVQMLDALTIAPVSLTATGTLFTQDLTGYASISVQVTSAGTTCTITYETSDDNTNWASTSGLFPGTTGASSPSTTTTTTGVTVFPRTGRYFRARVSTYTSGTVTVTAVASQTPVTGFGAQHAVILATSSAGFAAEDAAFTSGNLGLLGLGVRQDSRASSVSADGDYHTLVFDAANRLKVAPSGASTDWSVAAAMTDTTASTKASGGAGVRNRLCSVQVSHTLLGAATVLAVRDGTGGTVLWQVALDTSLNQGTSFPINPPICGSNATLMEVVLLTTPTTGTVYACVQGDVITS